MADAEPRFFMDRGLGARIVPTALRDAGWQVVTMDERYGADVSQLVDDVTWIREASEVGECLLTKDAAVARRPAEAHQIRMSDARVFALKRARATGPEMAAWLLAHENAIMRWATRVPAPFVLGIWPNRVGRVTLHQ